MILDPSATRGQPISPHRRINRKPSVWTRTEHDNGSRRQRGGTSCPYGCADVPIHNEVIWKLGKSMCRIVIRNYLAVARNLARGRKLQVQYRARKAGEKSQLCDPCRGGANPPSGAGIRDRQTKQSRCKVVRLSQRRLPRGLSVCLHGKGSSFAFSPLPDT